MLGAHGPRHDRWCPAIWARTTARRASPPSSRSRRTSARPARARRAGDCFALFDGEEAPAGVYRILPPGQGLRGSRAQRLRRSDARDGAARFIALRDEMLPRELEPGAVGAPAARRRSARCPTSHRARARRSSTARPFTQAGIPAVGSDPLLLPVPAAHVRRPQPGLRSAAWRRTTVSSSCATSAALIARAGVAAAAQHDLVLGHAGAARGCSGARSPARGSSSANGPQASAPVADEVMVMAGTATGPQRHHGPGRRPRAGRTVLISLLLELSFCRRTRSRDPAIAAGQGIPRLCGRDFGAALLCSRATTSRRAPPRRYPGVGETLVGRPGHGLSDIWARAQLRTGRLPSGGGG